MESNASIAELNTPEAVSAVLDILNPAAAQGDILYRGASLWSRLAAGTSGFALLTNGPGADPIWGQLGLDSLSDVDTSTVPPTDGQVLIWSEVDGEWQPGDGSVVGSITDLTDVDTLTTPPTDGQILIWSEVDGEWQPGDAAGGGGTFLELSDTPNAYTGFGEGNYYVDVNDDASQLSFDWIYNASGYQVIPSFGNGVSLPFSTGYSNSNFASKGDTFRADQSCVIKQVKANINSTAPYKLVVAEMSDATIGATITRILFDGPNVNAAGAGNDTVFNCGQSNQPAPLLEAGKTYCVLTCLQGSGNNGTNRITFLGGSASFNGAELTALYSCRYAEDIPAIGDSPNLESISSSYVEMQVDLWTGNALRSASDIIDEQIADAQGSILYRGASQWEALAPGTVDQVLKTKGPAANPAWEAEAGGGGAVVINDLTDVDTVTVPPTDGQILVWSQADGEWQPADAATGGGGGGGAGEAFTSLIEELILDTSTVVGGTIDVTGLDLSAYEDVLIYIDKVTCTEDANPAIRIYRGGVLLTSGYDSGVRSLSTNTTSTNDQRSTSGFLIAASDDAAWEADATGGAFTSESVLSELADGETAKFRSEHGSIGGTASPLVGLATGTVGGAGAVDGFQITTATTVGFGARLVTARVRIVGRRFAATGASPQAGLGFASWTPVPVDYFTQVGGVPQSIVYVDDKLFVDATGDRGSSTYFGEPVSGDFDRVYTAVGRIPNDANGALGIFIGDSSNGERSIAMVSLSNADFLVQNFGSGGFQSNGTNVGDDDLARPVSLVNGRHYWRMERVGATVTAYFSVDGFSWTVIGNFTPTENGIVTLDQIGFYMETDALAGGRPIGFTVLGIDDGPQPELRTGGSTAIAGGGGGGGELESFIVACSDEVSDLTVSAPAVKFRMPYAFSVTEVRASLSTAATGATLVTVDVNEGGVSILSTPVTIDATETTSTTATTPAVISDGLLAEDAEISVDIDAVGDTTTGAGLKVTLIGTKV